MIHKWKHFINLKALYQGNASFNKTFTLSKDTVERQRCMVKEAQAERRTWSWIPQPPGTRHVPRTHASALKGPVSAWKPLWCAVVVMRVRHPAQWPAHWYLSGRSNFTNGRLSDSKPHIFSPWHDTSLLVPLYNLTCSKHCYMILWCCFYRCVSWETGTKQGQSQESRQIRGLSRTRTRKKTASWLGGWLTQEKNCTAYGLEGKWRFPKQVRN